MTARPFRSHAVVHSGTARVTLVGELDVDSAAYVQKAVATCLVEQPKSLCLDLSGIGFCDCAGLNALLGARMSVLLAGVELAVEGIGPQLARLIDLIGATDILTEGHMEADTVPAHLE